MFPIVTNFTQLTVSSIVVTKILTALQCIKPGAWSYPVHFKPLAILLFCSYCYVFIFICQRYQISFGSDCLLLQNTFLHLNTIRLLGLSFSLVRTGLRYHGLALFNICIKKPLLFSTGFLNES